MNNPRAIQIVAPDHLVPIMAHDNDAGYDLFANIEGVHEIRPGDTFMVPTGVFLGLPDGFYAAVVPRSGLAAKHRVTIMNSPGTIDAGYRGEIKVILVNHGNEPYYVNPYDRIAQMIIKLVEPTRLIQVKELAPSQRGDSGFGSTGLNAKVETTSPTHMMSAARFFTELLVTDPDTHEPVTIALFKDEASGGIFAVDSSFIEQLDDPIVLEPFNGNLVVLKGV